MRTVSENMRFYVWCWITISFFVWVAIQIVYVSLLVPWDEAKFSVIFQALFVAGLITLPIVLLLGLAMFGIFLPIVMFMSRGDRACTFRPDEQVTIADESS